MGQSKQQKRAFAALEAAVAKLSQPENNPAQNALTQEALAGADYLKKGDFSSLPKGQYFNFEMPAAQLEKYRNLTNVGNEGTFALGELGLGGEIRSVPHLETRLREAARLGLGHAIIPPIGNMIPKLGGMALHEVRRLSQAMATM